MTHLVFGGADDGVAAPPGARGGHGGPRALPCHHLAVRGRLLHRRGARPGLLVQG